MGEGYSVFCPVIVGPRKQKNLWYLCVCVFFLYLLKIKHEFQVFQVVVERTQIAKLRADRDYCELEIQKIIILDVYFWNVKLKYFIGI